MLLTSICISGPRQEFAAKMGNLFGTYFLWPLCLSPIRYCYRECQLLHSQSNIRSCESASSGYRRAWIDHSSCIDFLSIPRSSVSKDEEEAPDHREPTGLGDVAI